MRKKLMRLLLVLGLISCLMVTASAETSYGGSDWKVSFTKDKKMESNFKSSDVSDAVYGLQPGDNVIIKLALKNDNSETTDWWMTNEVINSLEDKSETASGGAYTYKLTYTNPKGEETVLFSSDAVGGEETSGSGEGLHAATDALKNYFYLDTLTTGQSGYVTLEVALDGETQGNNYQDTLADLQMNFAVELNDSGTRGTSSTSPSPGSTSKRIVVNTGDETDLMPFIIAAAVSGVVLLLLAIYGVKSRKKDDEEEAEA